MQLQHPLCPTFYIPGHLEEKRVNELGQRACMALRNQGRVLIAGKYFAVTIGHEDAGTHAVEYANDDFKHSAAFGLERDLVRAIAAQSVDDTDVQAQERILNCSPASFLGEVLKGVPKLPSLQSPQQVTCGPFLPSNFTEDDLMGLTAVVRAPAPTSGETASGGLIALFLCRRY